MSAWPAPAHGNAARPLEDDDLRWRADAARHDCALRPERADQPRCLRSICRQRAGPGASPRRHRGHGQSLQPQGVKGARDDRGRRRRTQVPAALQSRLQSDRKRILKAQGNAAKGRRAHHRRPVDRHRTHRRHLRSSRMRQLLLRLRIRYRAMGFRSSSPLLRPVPGRHNSQKERERTSTPPRRSRTR